MLSFGRFKLAAGIIILVVILVQIILFMKSGQKYSDSGSTKQKDMFQSPDNEQLVDLVRTTLMIPPSRDPYNLTSAEENPSQGQVQHIQNILFRFKNGTFVECGAHDGEHHSNTIWLERRHGWSGLLIEPDFETFKKLRSKNRKAWLANVCLSSKPYLEQIEFYRNPRNTSWNSIIKSRVLEHTDENKFKVLCIPIETLLLAAGLPRVDFFSLDVEGYELEVMKGFPFDKFPVKIFVIEYVHIPNNGAQHLHELMTKNSYNLHFNQTTTKDLIYFHSSLNI